MKLYDTKEDENAFDEWFYGLKKEHFYLTHKEMMKIAWLEAIKYEHTKPIRTYRWNGVI